MKRLLIIAIIACAAVTANAQTQYGFYTISPGAGQYFLATAISPNGKYIAGWLGSGVGSGIYDTETQDFYYYYSDGVNSAEFSAVMDDGTMVGYAYSGNDLVYAYNPITDTKWIDNSVFDLWAKGTTPNGEVMVGTYWDAAYRGYCCYWENGAAARALSSPDAKEIEFGYTGGDGEEDDWSYQYCEAVDVCDDGSIIVGNVYGWLLNGGALVWNRDDATGEYTLDAICAGLVESAWEGSHPYCQYQATAISANGKYIALYMQDNDGTLQGSATYMGRYDTETGEVETAHCDTDCTPARIANDGTIVGWTGDQSSQSRAPLIWEPGKGIEYMEEKYPYATGFTDWQQEDWSFPCGITPDGRYIAGGGWYYFEGESDYYARDATWFFDTEQYKTATGIQSVTAADDINSSSAQYYSVDGVRLSAPQKGLNLIRANGTTKKVIVR